MKTITCIADLLYTSKFEIYRALLQYCDPEHAALITFWIDHNTGPKNFQRYAYGLSVMSLGAEPIEISKSVLDKLFEVWEHNYHRSEGLISLVEKS